MNEGDLMKPLLSSGVGLLSLLYRRHTGTERSHDERPHVGHRVDGWQRRLLDASSGACCRCWFGRLGSQAEEEVVDQWQYLAMSSSAAARMHERTSDRYPHGPPRPWSRQQRGPLTWFSFRSTRGTTAPCVAGRHRSAWLVPNQTRGAARQCRRRSLSHHPAAAASGSSAELGRWRRPAPR